jgi:hypothetical protein
MVVECINLIAKCYTRQIKSQIIKFIDTCKKKILSKLKLCRVFPTRKLASFYRILNPTKEIQEKMENGQFAYGVLFS